MLRQSRLIALMLLGLLPALPAAAGSGNIFVSSEKDDAIAVLDGSTYEVIKTIATSERPRHMQFSHDRKLIYAACGEGESIDIIDVATLEKVGAFGDIEDPEVFDLSPDGKLMFISLEDDAALGVLDLESGEMVAEIEVGEEPEGVLASPDGRAVYVTSEVANIVHVVDVESREIRANIVAGNRPRRFAITPDGKELWVSNELSCSVSIIDIAANKVLHEISFLPRGFRPEQVTPVGLTMTGDGETVFVGLGRANHVAVVDAKDREVKDYLLVGERAWNVTLDRPEKRLLVVNGLSDDISIIDVEALRVVKSVPVGRVPHTILVDD